MAQTTYNSSGSCSKDITTVSWKMLRQPSQMPSRQSAPYPKFLISSHPPVTTRVSLDSINGCVISVPSVTRDARQELPVELPELIDVEPAAPDPDAPERVRPDVADIARREHQADFRVTDPRGVETEGRGHDVERLVLRQVPD